MEPSRSEHAYLPSHAGYLSSYEDIASTSRPVLALAADGRPLSLRDALLPLLEECLPRRGGSSGSGGALATSAAAPPSLVAAVQSLPGTPVARSSSTADGGGGSGSATPAVQASADAELPPALEVSEGQPRGTDGDEASSSLAAAGAATGAAATAAMMQGGGAPAGEAAAQLEQAAADGRVLVAGVTPSLDTPLAWLHAQLHAPDYFLYIVVHLPLAR